ncbi:hypothetical protein ELY21_04130 [Legionella sp. km535]|uniref:putative Ig domain-containing protein n=1 Tax=Legionella sp. km535 TaxID=2498107 RepID=UPI000F8DDDBC|nr:putative Ig domain-containing protein [Legionella sp. km535]RUR19416.1 hypothetical protein ELY21_04130 [Legionella sp. km535]
MKRALLLFVIFYISSSVSYALPQQVRMTFTASPPSTVFLDDTVRIPVQMDWYATVRIPMTYGKWDLPEGARIEYVTGYCPELMSAVAFGFPYTCYFNIVISKNSVGTVSGPITYDVCRYCPILEHVFYTPSFSVRVIPHGITMSAIPIQEATANTPFVYNLKTAVKFYDENLRAGFPPYGIVTPAEQDGLRFDQASFSIVGTPKRTGTYLFKVGAQNTYGTAAQVDFRVQVRVNEKDKPVFKQNYSIASALPDQKYSLNLMDLVEQHAGFMQTNQISFRIDEDSSHPDWLDISRNDVTRLEGKVPPTAAGQEVEVTLIASSNTGGDCLRPLTIKIPVAYDPTKKPTINSFKLEKLAGANIYEELSGYINDPSHDPKIKLILEKVEPAASWLHISPLNPTVLEGTVPDQATGQKYLLTLRANTLIGGNSDPVTIPLNISVDKKQMPRFKSDKPILPILYPGQPYLYDFVENNDVYPEYHDAPYEIQFAEGFNPPDWLRLEQNQLIADMVPPEIVNEDLEIKIMIKNIPGGLSNEYILSLTIMN